MRKNRKIEKRMSVVATNTMYFGAIIIFFFIMVILNLLSSSSCTQLLKTKGVLERELAKLEDARTRESLRWEAMKTPENIESALWRHGLKMKMPRPDQTVRMRPDGAPFPGQLSLARARQLGVNARTASVSPTMKRPLSRSTGYRRPRGR